MKNPQLNLLKKLVKLKHPNKRITKNYDWVDGKIKTSLCVGKYNQGCPEFEYWIEDIKYLHRNYILESIGI